MGCGNIAVSDFPETMRKQEKEVEDVDMDDRESRNAASSVDFNCQYRPEEFAVDFLEMTNYTPESKINYKKARQIYLKQFTFLRAEDVDHTYQYMFLNRLESKQLSVEQIEQEQLSCLQFIKFGYIFYRFYQVLQDPRLVLFYYLDDNFNSHVNFKQLKQLLRIHFGIDVKNAQLIFQRVKAKNGLINQANFNKLLAILTASKTYDPLSSYFMQERDQEHMPENFDRAIQPENQDEIFSDISTKRQEYEQAKKFIEDEKRKQKAKKKRDAQFETE
ncbi:Conserved_hypothetical protein [Hexamita inflata]|uniref:Uncharacterized protein n=1 Tax=Hexamita inflata TaxID=28002 RepID=A0AA86RQI0_9EUKA|nr:Conserved hypothetical protein [Hexamita inflata]